jgi:PPOX class probable F420-dependent enzyme
VRKDLPVAALGDLLDLPLLATLATYRGDGRVLLSPVWHEWRDGGFLIIVGADDVKARHLRRDPRAVAVLAENDPPYRGIEVSGEVSIDIDPALALEAVRRIAVRYLGEKRGLAYVGDSGDGMAIVHLKPGRLRTWDFTDEYSSQSLG